ncbi:GNAT family N-acetyltransferase [Gaoshiqia sp. Z1-71]|uniref:GNAT family N-acetyltransferase n=1 Tax=Gaoshiqia hydrogeniformans TaxID=3290090 RepID=UPI003BF8D3E7
MIEVQRTDSVNSDFIKLVQSLDEELAKIDGSDHSFYAQFNKIERLRYVVVAYENGIPLGCGAIKEFDHQTMEVKRMFTDPKGRRKGIAVHVLTELEDWANELSFSRCVLETGKKQPEAIALYKKSGYQVIPNYGQYAGVENSVCFEKLIRK